MPSLKSILSAAVVLALAALPFTSAASARTRPFTVRAYQPPYPVGQGLSGYHLNPYQGYFYLTKKAPSPTYVLDVDHSGQAILTSDGPIYLDTANGLLGYTASASAKPPASALFAYFAHLGNGTTTSPPDAVFKWIGSDNSYWYACPWSAGKYQLVKAMTDSHPDLGSCTGVQLAALDA